MEASRLGISLWYKAFRMYFLCDRTDAAYVFMTTFRLKYIVQNYIIVLNTTDLDDRQGKISVMCVWARNWRSWRTKLREQNSYIDADINGAKSCQVRRSSGTRWCYRGRGWGNDRSLAVSPTCEVQAAQKQPLKVWGVCLLLTWVSMLLAKWWWTEVVLDHFRPIDCLGPQCLCMDSKISEVLPC